MQTDLAEKLLIYDITIIILFLAAGIQAGLNSLPEKGGTAKRKGFSAERELVWYLWKHGFAAIRAPASGARTKKVFYPDVVAIFQGKVFVFEVKLRRRLEPLTMKKIKVEKLLDFARRAGGQAYIAIKTSYPRDWILVELDEEIISKLEARNYLYLSIEIIKKKGISLRNLVNKVINRPLNVFTENKI